MILIVQNHGDVPAGIYAEFLQKARIPFRILRPDLGEVFPSPHSAMAVIVLGGYMGAHDEEIYPFLRELKAFIRDCVASDIPFLGICLGGQLLAAILGAEVTAQARGEKGLVQLTLTAEGEHDPLFDGIPPAFPAFQWHNDSFALPAAAQWLAFSPVCPGQAFRYGRAWGVQFHPEVDQAIIQRWSRGSAAAEFYLRDFSRREVLLRSFGVRLLGNFLAIAGC